MVRLFPYLIIGLMIMAAIPYLLAGDWRHALYWVSAAMVNFSATML